MCIYIVYKNISPETGFRTFILYADTTIEDLVGLAFPVALCCQKSYSLSRPETCSDRILPVYSAIEIHGPF